MSVGGIFFVDTQKNHFPTPVKRAKMPFVKALQKIPDFIKQSYEELTKAKWPTKDETVKLTVSLIVISAGMGFFVSFWDYIFKGLLTLLINR